MLGNRNAIAMLPVGNLGRAKEFYDHTLRLRRLTDDDPEVLMYESGDTKIAVYRSQFAGTNQATALSWDVGEDLEEIVRALKARGVEFEHYDLPGMTRSGDVHVGGPMKTAWFKDPDGNILGIMGTSR